MIQFPFISGSKSQNLLKPLTVTGNGRFAAPQGFDGYSYVYVAVKPSMACNSQRVSFCDTKPFDYNITELSHPAVCSSLNATVNGLYLPPEGYDGFSTVMVNVAQPHMVRNCYHSYLNYAGSFKLSATIAVTTQEG